MVRIPENPENITPRHVEQALKEAWRKFDQFEAGVDFSQPENVINELYRPYQQAADLCRSLRNIGLDSQRREIDSLP